MAELTSPFGAAAGGACACAGVWVGWWVHVRVRGEEAWYIQDGGIL